eukprot:TRINITY_DN8798_c0_g1_i2.p1 TRINITY_DN8798_c0_g1~~TRINITY_DN8798_c0_g1_i2.p1  ORF type:complete len:393 (+),score=89.98 TRINITY_DN8798_c0_g1_i2:81-1259(+)
MGCAGSGATKSEVEAIVQRQQDNAQKEQAARELKAREQALRAQRDALERTLQESKEMHAQTLKELKEAREPKAAHEELLKAHEYLDDKHMQKVAEIERINQELRERVDRMEASVGDVHAQTRGFQDEIRQSPSKAAQEALAMIQFANSQENPWLAHRAQWEELHSSTQMVAATINNRLVCAEGHLNLVPELDDLEVMSLHGKEWDEAPTAGKEGDQVPVDTLQHQEEPRREGWPELQTGKEGGPRPPEAVAVHPPAPGAPERIDMVGALLDKHATGLAPGGSCPPESPSPLQHLDMVGALLDKHATGLAPGDSRSPDSPSPPQNLDLVRNMLGEHAKNVAAGGPDPPSSTAVTRPPTAPAAKDGQARPLQKEEVIEVGVKLHKLLRDNARAG